MLLNKLTTRRQAERDELAWCKRRLTARNVPLEKSEVATRLDSLMEGAPYRAARQAQAQEEQKYLEHLRRSAVASMQLSSAAMDVPQAVTLLAGAIMVQFPDPQMQIIRLDLLLTI